MQELIFRFTRIGRIIDPRYPTNLAILIWAVAGAALVFALRFASGNPLDVAVRAALVAGIMLGIAWALARELDPPQPIAAFVPVLLVSAALLITGPTADLLPLIYTIPTIRMINRFSGLPVTWGDSLLLLAFTGALCWWGGWTYALPGVIAFALDALLPVPDRKQWLFAALSAVIGAAAFATATGTSPVLTLPGIGHALIVLAAVLLFVPVIRRTGHSRIEGEITGVPLPPVRVQAGQMYIIFFLIYAVLWRGDAAVIGLLPVSLTLIGVALYPLVRPLLPQRLQRL
jgi:hypothetical protein